MLKKGISNTLIDGRLKLSVLTEVKQFSEDHSIYLFSREPKNESKPLKYSNEFSLLRKKLVLRINIGPG